MKRKSVPGFYQPDASDHVCADPDPFRIQFYEFHQYWCDPGIFPGQLHKIIYDAGACGHDRRFSAFSFGKLCSGNCFWDCWCDRIFYSQKRTQSVFSAVNQIPVVNADVVTGFSVCILLVIVFGMSKDTYVPLVIGHTVLVLRLYIYLFCLN